ncbi:heparin lyase I family protein [Microbacterium sp. W4I20]|uniref:heparin lyase I family protein n=1 Tax=Microbacterium sp. W4I20 TaxID=3042262 RepID=UPI0027D870FD|nr:heparin lyase I family protein [Microbacterium sp. W4I20]
MRVSRRTLFRLSGAAAVGAVVGVPLAGFGAPLTAGAAEACNALMHQDGFGSPTVGSWLESDFDSTSLRIPAGSRWDDAALFNPSRFAIVPDPAGSAESVMRFTVPGNGSAYRAELMRRQLSYGRYRFTVSVFVPQDFVPYRWDTIVAQWHAFRLPNGRDTNPPLALSIDTLAPVWDFRIAQLQPDLTTRITRYVLPVPVRYGAWTDWSFDIVWSTPTTPGRVVILQDGAEVLRFDGVNNYHQASSPYFQTGIYRPVWRNGYAPTAPVHIYHRGITIRDLTACATVPAPTGVPDAMTSDGERVVLSPLANDLAVGAATTVDPTSLRLVDADGALVTELDVPGEGLWSVDPATAQVSFAAAATFVGAVDPRSYRVRFVAADGTFQTFGSELTIEVRRAEITVPSGAVTSSGPGTVTLTPLAGVGDVNASTLRLVDPLTSEESSTVVLDGQGVFAAPGDGTVEFTPEVGFEGVASVGLVVDDRFDRAVVSSVTVSVIDNPRPAGLAPTEPGLSGASRSPGSPGSGGVGSAGAGVRDGRMLAATGGAVPSSLVALGVGAVVAGAALAGHDARTSSRSAD